MKKFFAVLLAAAVLCGFSACSNGNNKEYPVKIANVTINEKPTSVVCLSDSVADIMIACGYMDKITARSDECTQGEILSISSVGKKSEPDINKILAVDPDIVFADKTVSDTTVKKLNDKGVTVLKMVTAQSTEELTLLYQNISAVLGGNIKGRENGEEKAESIITTMGDLQRIIPQTEVVPTVCYLYDVNGTAVTDHSFCGKIFSYANTVNVCSVQNPNNMFDIIKLSDPQYIFCDTGVKDQIMSSKEYKDFSAVKNKKVYEIDKAVFERQGNSITEVLSYIIEIIYPEFGTSSQDSNSAQSSDENSEIKIPFEITDDMEYKQNDENNNILEIQKRLVELGFMKDDPTGYYGEITLNAVKNFEKANGLEENGVLDSNDIKIIFSKDAKSAETEPSEETKPTEE